MGATNPTPPAGRVRLTLDEWQQVFVLLTILSGYFSIAVSQIALGVAVLVALLRWTRRESPFPATGLEKTALLFVAWALLLIPFSTDASQSLLYSRRFYLFSAIWVGAGVATGDRRRRLLFGFLLAAAAAAALYGQIYHLKHYGSLMSQRMSVVFNAMTGGALFMMAALVAAGCLIAPGVGRRTRAWAAAAAIPILLGVVMTMTRSAQLGLIAGLGVMFLLRGPRLAGGFAVVVLVAGVLLAVWGEGVVPPRYWKRIQPGFVLEGKNTVARLEMWKGGWQMIQARPIRGMGDRGLEEIGPDYYVSETDTYWGHMHSNLVHMAVIWGIPGFLLGQAFTVMALILLIRRWRRQIERFRRSEVATAATGWILGAIGVWVGFYIAGLTEWYFGDAESMLIYFLIIGCALGRDDESEPAANP